MSLVQLYISQLTWHVGFERSWLESWWKNIVSNPQHPVLDFDKQTFLVILPTLWSIRFMPTITMMESWKTVDFSWTLLRRGFLRKRTVTACVSMMREESGVHGMNPLQIIRTITCWIIALCCSWGGSRVVRFTKDGEVDFQIIFPTALNVTACCFGGRYRCSLYSSNG